MRHLGLSKKSGLPEYPEHDSFIAIKFLSENPPPVFQQDSDDDPQATFWGNPYFQTNPAAEAKVWTSCDLSQGTTRFSCDKLSDPAI